MLLYLSAQIAKVPSKETEWVTWFVSLFQVTLCVQDSTASFFYTNTSSACSMHLVFNPFGVEWDSVSQLIAPVGGTRVILITGWWFGTWIVFIHILGMSSSQLTNSIMFQRGRAKNHQPEGIPYKSPYKSQINPHQESQNIFPSLVVALHVNSASSPYKST